MQRSTASSRQASSGRRGANNGFKFHNFVFNEDNQSFCLEEQHGNKKITVLHWKKSEPRGGGSGVVVNSRSNKNAHEDAIDRTACDAHSRRSATAATSTSSCDRRLNKIALDDASSVNSAKACERQILDVCTSASFPPPNGRERSVNKSSQFVLPTQQYLHQLQQQHQQPQSQSQPQLKSQLQQTAAMAHNLNLSSHESLISLPLQYRAPVAGVEAAAAYELRHTSSGPSAFLRDPFQSIVGGGGSREQEPRQRHQPPSPYSSASSSAIEQLMIRSALSTGATTTSAFSPIATSSSASSSSSQIANWLNQSLNDLELTEPISVGRAPPTQAPSSISAMNRRKATSVRRIATNIADSDHSDFEEEEEEEKENDNKNNDHDNYDDDNDDDVYIDVEKVKKSPENKINDNEDDNDDMLNDCSSIVSAFEAYRNFLQTFTRDEEMMISATAQSQPLDLSTKSANRDINNNTNDNSFNIESIFGPDRKSEAEKKMDANENDDSMSRMDEHNDYHDDHHRNEDRLQVPRFVDESTTHSRTSIRSETVSPSTLLSSVKLDSSSSPKSSPHNPFIYSNPFFAPQQISNNNDASSFKSYHQQPNRRLDHLLPSEYQHHHHQQSTCWSSTTTSPPSPQNPHPKPYIFDTFLEDEISKMLRSPSVKSFSSRSTPNRDNNKKSEIRSDDVSIDQRIDERLRSLHSEILRRTQSFDRRHETSVDDHLKLHFKLDSNRNLERYDSLERNSAATKTTVPSEPVLFAHAQMQALEQLLSKNRVASVPASTQRSQIKRQLEDAFRQNGFLVKTKQVSDANNSAMFCKFRQLRKYTRYYLKSWQNHLPDEVNKLWKGFLPPKSDRPLYIDHSDATTSVSPLRVGRFSDFENVSTMSCSSGAPPQPPPPPPTTESCSSSASMSTEMC